VSDQFLHVIFFTETSGQVTTSTGKVGWGSVAGYMAAGCGMMGMEIVRYTISRVYAELYFSFGMGNSIAAPIIPIMTNAN
jgi:hypothetical protein